MPAKEGGVVLKRFEGKPVASSTIRVTKAGDGLSEALRLDPVALKHEQEVYLVLRGIVRQVNYRPIAGSDGILTRQHTVEASAVAMVTREAVEDFLAAEADRVAKMKEEADGVIRLPLEEAAGDAAMGWDEVDEG